MDYKCLNLLGEFAQLLNATAIDATFDIWGDPEWPNEGDTELSLKLRLINGDVVERSFGFDQCESSIIPKDRRIVSVKPFGELARAIELWRSWQGNPDQFEPLEWTAYSLHDSEEFNWIIGDTIVAFHLICELKYLYQMGVVIAWKSGNYLSLKGGRSGCIISSGADYRHGSWNVVQVVIDQNTIAHSE